MEVDNMMTKAQDALTVRRVFGEPVLQDGLTLIPVAKVRGGGGGGDGEGPDGEGKGSGGGFGLTAEPLGALVIQGDEVNWRPTLDLNRVLYGAEVVAIVALLTSRSIVKALTHKDRSGLRRQTSIGGIGPRWVWQPGGLPCPRE